MEDLYHELYERFVGLQESSSGLLAYVDRRIRELKKHYEANLGWARYEAELVTDLNDWLSEQLHLQAGRLRDLAVPDVPATEWLGVGSTPARDDGEEEGEAASGADEPADDDEAPRELRRRRREERALNDEEDRLRDEGFDDPPRTKTPLCAGGARRVRTRAPEASASGAIRVVPLGTIRTMLRRDREVLGNPLRPGAAVGTPGWSGYAGRPFAGGRPAVRPPLSPPEEIRNGRSRTCR